jgi:hypothetical protein
MLHRLCDKNEAELLAVTACYSSPYIAGCIDSINQFYGRQVPVGVNYDLDTSDGGVYARALCDMFPNQYPAINYKTELSAPDTLIVLRKTLAESEDNSVTIVATGPLGSLAKLVVSGGDEISPLTGKELIEKKVARTVVMGGRFFESWPMVIYPDGTPNGTPVTWEWNIKGSGLWAAKTVCDEWPGELVFSSYEIGSYIHTMRGYPDKAQKGDPVALAYLIHNRGYGRCSWDQTAMLEGVRPGQYWNYHEFGKISVAEELVTHWSPDSTRRHTYLLPKVNYDVVRQTIDDLVDGV